MAQTSWSNIASQTAANKRYRKYDGLSFDRTSHCTVLRAPQLWGTQPVKGKSKGH